MSDINTMSDISKLFYVFMPNITYKSCYYLSILLPTRFVIFTCRYFKLNRDTTAPSQPNTKNFWWSSINTGIPTVTNSTVSRPSLLLLTSCCLSDKSKLHSRARKVQPWWRRESCMVEEKDKRGVISWRKYLFLRRFLEFNHFSSFLVV